VIKALRELFQKPVAEDRPRLGALLGRDPGGKAADAVLVVDGSVPPDCEWIAAEFPGATRLRQSRAEGLPFRDGETRALPARDGGWDLIVLVDVVDRVLDPAWAFRAVADALGRGGCALLLQAVAPDDAAARADWNVLCRLRNAAHTWTPTRRQVRAFPTASGFRRGAEVLWAESVPLRAVRGETEESLRHFADDVDGRGLVSADRVAVTRLGLVLERE